MKHGGKNCPCSLPIKKQIKTFYPYLKKIGGSKTFAKKQELFKTAPKCLTKFISNCAGAILREDIKLPQETLKKLKRHKNILIELDKKTSLSKKQKQFFDKKGGAFPLIPIIASLLGNVAIPYVVQKLTNG
jgi:hypothetical protein